MRPYLVLLTLLFLTVSANAEYRAFELGISDQEGNVIRTVKSNFDHIQYPQYYPLNRGERIDYLDSWMCWERTNLQEICPKPTATPNEATQNRLPATDEGP